GLSWIHPGIIRTRSVDFLIHRLDKPWYGYIRGFCGLYQPFVYLHKLIPL
ncbi:hypothetical protein K443DRAFT_116961, partial [Laccaria amethystina LaAM-08-1]